MEITWENTPHKVRFDSLGYNGVFKHGDYIYLKLCAAQDMNFYNGQCLGNDSQSKNFEPECLVEVVVAINVTT